MRRFTTFITENDTPKFHRDNPGGEWLAKHRGYAEEDMRDGRRHTTKGNGLNGKTTGYFSKALHLPTKHLKDIHGAMGEHEFRNNFNSHKHTELSKSVKEHGFDTKDHAILIGVNHRGKPHVLEGNHRLAHAIKHGHKRIHAEVKYYNGGEDVKGKGFHPDQVAHLHSHGEYKGLSDA